jgi:hypothetical protein
LSDINTTVHGTSSFGSSVTGQERLASHPLLLTPGEGASGTYWLVDGIVSRADLGLMTKEEIPPNARNITRIFKPVSFCLLSPGFSL